MVLLQIINSETNNINSNQKKKKKKREWLGSIDILSCRFGPYILESINLITGLEGAGVARRRSLPTSNKELKS
uniref:Uncharacterized protein n=1 Tax=Lotus japonicus TaxID=34305 RepID=I3S605_LOTJA|nr:unknown [Lotus japonicus]